MVLDRARIRGFVCRGKTVKVLFVCPGLGKEVAALESETEKHSPKRRVFCLRTIFWNVSKIVLGVNAVEGTEAILR